MNPSRQHNIFQVTNPAISAKLVSDVFELVFILLRPVSHDQAQLKITDSQTIFLVKTKEKTTFNYFEVGGTEMSAITLEINYLEDLNKKLVSENEQVDSIADNGGCGLSFHVLDPDGNKLHLWGGWPQK